MMGLPAARSGQLRRFAGLLAVLVLMASAVPAAQGQPRAKAKSPRATPNQSALRGLDRATSITVARQPSALASATAFTTRTRSAPPPRVPGSKWTLRAAAISIRESNSRCGNVVLSVGSYDRVFGCYFVKVEVTLP